MKPSRVLFYLLFSMFVFNQSHAQANKNLEPTILKYDPFVWKSEAPKDMPFKNSITFTGIKFLGLKSGFRYGDTWYPTWASNDTLYSPWTDGTTARLDGSLEKANSGYPEKGIPVTSKYHNTTGQGVMIGDDPLTLKVYSTGLVRAASFPYQGRYPSGSLIHNGIWYYGTYVLDPSAEAQYGDTRYNWPWMGPFVGFRTSTDYGKTWQADPNTPEKSIFGESGINGYPVKIGSPHFVDFGKNMKHSPDGKAYLVAHGSEITDAHPRFANTSWITGDQIYLMRVTPSIETINDPSKYEFFAGNDLEGNPIWTRDFKYIKPLLEWNNNMGCVTVTYNAKLKKYLMCVTDGRNTASKMNTYILESDKLTGDWKTITYMKDFGEQAYFVNIPSKFISDDGKTMWLLYSGNFATDWNGERIIENPPGSHYGLVFQKIELLTK